MAFSSVFLSTLLFTLVSFISLKIDGTLISTLSSPVKASKFLVKNVDEPDIAVKLILYNSTYYDERTLTAFDKSYTPVVMWHGMGDSAYGSINIDRLAIQETLNNISVFSVQIGDNQVEDELGGYFGNANHQVAEICRQLLENDIIKRHGSLNCIGFSQGAQFMRALIQRCPFQENKIRVKNFISIGGQHQGVFGLPRCQSKPFCEHIRYLLTYAAYEIRVQEHLIQAEYWHDPKNEEEYKRKNIFLADINNELIVNETYKLNLMQLDAFVLVKFTEDMMITPRESSYFEFYKSGSDSEILPLNKSSIYDRLGLRQLHESNRIHFKNKQGDHLEYSMKWFLEEIITPYLKN